MSYKVVFSRQDQKDARKLKSNLSQPEQASELLDILVTDPFQSPPRYEQLTGNLQGCYSRRINIQHRIVYEVIEKSKTVLVLRMWTHYGE